MTKYASELEDFLDLLQATARWKKAGAAIVEKDYYLTRALRALAEGYKGEFILKGGTSLTKGWSLHQRFSEDIDVLLRAETNAGQAARHTRLKNFAETVERAEGFTSANVINSETGKHRTVSFLYRSVTSGDPPALSKTVLLEAGHRGNTSAATSRAVRSMVTEFAERNGQTGLAADLTPFDIEMQTVQRTFVEKLFAIHAAYALNMAAGKARHYYDLSEMATLSEIKAFVGTPNYRRCVAEVRKFSLENFPNQTVPPDDSFQSSPAFQPDQDGLKALEQSWKAEKHLFFGSQPSLTDVLQTLADLRPKL